MLLLVLVLVLMPMLMYICTLVSVIQSVPGQGKK